MQMQHFLLSQLTTETTRKAAVCVRVIRKWIFDANRQNGPILRIDLVLADKEGNAIYAEIPQPQIQSKGPLLDIDQTYVISRFLVRKSKATYRPFDTHHMIEFTGYTLITPAKDPPSAFPSIIYNIKHFHEIDPIGAAGLNYVDVIGVIVDVQTLSSKSIKGNDAPSPIREVTIKDLKDGEMQITLWGQKAIDFNIDHLYDLAATKPIVALFVGCLPKNICNRTQLSGGHACYWYFNPDIEEAAPFYTRFQNQVIQLHLPPPNTLEAEQPVQARPLEHKSLEELNDINPYDFPDEGYKCTVTIKYIPDDGSWWYLSCEKCKTAAHEQDGQFRCPICQWTVTLPRYRLSFTAADQTAQAKFFCFDETARQIVRRPCKSLINPLRTAAFPRELAAIINREFLFSVTLTKDSYRSEELRKYLVNSVSIPHQQIAIANPPPTQTALQILPAPATKLAIEDASDHRTQDHPDDAIANVTPPPAADPDQTPSKELPAQSTDKTAHVRKRLFGDASAAETHSAAAKHSERIIEEAQTAEAIETATDKDDDASTQTLAKKPRTTQSKHHEETSTSGRSAGRKASSGHHKK